MGKFGAANNIGSILGPVLVGSLIGLNLFDVKINQFGLLTPLIIMSILMAIASLVVYFYLPNSPSSNQDARSTDFVFDRNLKTRSSQCNSILEGN